MTNLSFDRQIDEYMVYCRSKQLREKTMASYEQTLRSLNDGVKSRWVLSLLTKLPNLLYDAI